MATWYPNAVRKPIVRNFGGRRSRTRAVVLHVDAGGANSLQGWFNSPASGASSHFYVKYDGTVEQYVDADLVAWTQREGNASCVGIETQGKGDGMWTPAQLRALAALVRWLCDRYGIPKASMGNSRTTSRGIGYHRMGIDPWRVSGGETWGPRGKVCPGNDRVVQFPGLVASVAAGAVGNPIGGGGSVTIPTIPGRPAPIEEDDLTPDQARKLDAIYAALFDGGTSMPGGQPMKDRLEQHFAEVKAQNTDIAKRVNEFRAASISGADLRALIAAIPGLVWQVTVNRGSRKIPVIQELADIKTNQEKKG